jgi:DNA polymerase-3 subunit beta
VKFRCERDSLGDAISTAQRAVASRSGALPVLSGLRLTAGDGTVELVGSDLELTIRVRVAAQVDEGGQAVLPAKLFNDIVAKLEAGSVEVATDDSGEGDQATIQGGRASYTLRLLPLDDFPHLPEPEGAAIAVDAGPLADALRGVIPAASRDDARPILTGVLLTARQQGLRLVATDSYRLAVRDLEGVSMLAEGQHVLVGAKALGEVQRLLTDGEMQVVLSERDVRFSGPKGEITARLIDGEFPNYEQLIPSGYPNRLTVSREALADAVRRMQLVGQGRDSSPVRLTMSAEGVELSSTAQEVGEAHEMVDAKYEGSDLTVAFNAQFLLDGTQAVSGAEVVLEALDPLKPATLRAVDQNDFMYLLMPVRIS